MSSSPRARTSPKRVREITDGKGVPVVYDSVGKDTLMASLDSLQPRGVLVSNGTSSGPVVVDTTLLAMKGSIWLTRPAMVHYATPRSHMLDMAREVFDWVLAGKIASEPNQTFALADAAEAHRALEFAPDGRLHRPQALRPAEPRGSRSWMGWPPSDRCRSPRCCGTPSATIATAKSCRGGSRATCTAAAAPS